MSVARLVAITVIVVLLAALVRESHFAPDRRAQLQRAIANGHVGVLDAEESTRFYKELAWLARIAGIKGDIILNQTTSAEDDRLHVFVTDAVTYPNTLRIVACRRGNAVYDAELRAIFVDVSLLRTDEFNGIFEASGVGSVTSLDVPFHHMFRHFVVLHEMGHHLLHRTTAGVFDLAPSNPSENEAAKVRESEADAFGLRRLLAAYADEKAVKEGLPAAGIAERLGVEKMDGIASSITFEAYGGFLLEGFFKAFTAPEYGAYYEDRAHANLFARSSDLFQSVQGGALFGTPAANTDPMAILGRMLLLKRSISPSVTSAEVIVPWPIGGAVLTGDGILVSNAKNDERIEVRVDKPVKRHVQGFDSSGSVDSRNGWWDCLLYRMRLASACKRPWPLGEAHALLSDPGTFDTNWTTPEGTLIADVSRKYYRPTYPPYPPSFAVRRRDSPAEVEIALPDNSRQVVSLKAASEKVARAIGSPTVKLELSGASSHDIHLLAYQGAQENEPVALAAVSLDGKRATTFDLRKLSPSTRKATTILGTKDHARAFAPYVWNSGLEAGRVWQIDEIKTSGERIRRAMMVAPLLGMQQTLPELERAFASRITRLLPLGPDQLIVQAELEGLFVVDIREGMTTPRSVFPFGFDSLRLATSEDRRVLVYVPGGTRCFILYPDRLKAAG